MAGMCVVQVTFSPDGRWVLSASFDKSIKLWDGVKGTFVATFRNHVGPVFQVGRWHGMAWYVKDASKCVHACGCPSHCGVCDRESQHGAGAAWSLNSVC